MIGTPSVALADWVRARFWELQIPLTIVMAPGDVGVTALSDFGERIHFPDQGAVQFFLMGYRLGEAHALDPLLASPYVSPTVEPADQEAETPEGS
jgi:hypothetical protein